MFRDYFMIFLLVHIIGDFYVQTENIAAKKEAALRWLLIHCLQYLLAAFVILLPVMPPQIVLFGLALAITHAIIDILKFRYLKHIKKSGKQNITNERNVFFADQILHLVCLVLIAYICTIKLNSLSFNQSVAEFFHVMGISGITLISWTVTLLLIHKPANIIISKLIKIYKPEENEDEKKRDNNAGRFIGTIERIIVLIFISINQYSAIGLVLTAKSIARYDRISKEKDFAEYYLLGTLISTLLVIICASTI